MINDQRDVAGVIEQAEQINERLLNALQAVYLRDQRPIPLPRLCRCGRPTRLSFGPRPVCRDCLRYERAVLATRPTEAARRALFVVWQGRG